MRRRGSSRAGKNEPSRSLGMCSFTSPALVERSTGAAAVAVGRAFLGALVAAGADDLLGLELDELLEDQGHGVAEGVLAATRTDGIEQLGQGRL